MPISTSGSYYALKHSAHRCCSSVFLDHLCTHTHPLSPSLCVYAVSLALSLRHGECACVYQEDKEQLVGADGLCHVGSRDRIKMAGLAGSGLSLLSYFRRPWNRVSPNYCNWVTI